MGVRRCPLTAVKFCGHVPTWPHSSLFLQAFPGSVLGREGQDAPWQGGALLILCGLTLTPRSCPCPERPLPTSSSRAKELSRPAAKTAMVAQTWMGHVGNQASQGDLRVQPSSRSQREKLTRQAGL